MNLLNLKTGNQAFKDCLRLNFSKLFRQCAMQGVIVLLTGFAGVTFAKTSGAPSDQAVNDLVISNNNANEMQLEVRQMPLAQVLDTLAGKTRATLHYSELPAGLVTATCTGMALKQVLECLLDNKADIVVRFEHAPGLAGKNEQVAEAWILGSGLSNNASSTDSNVSLAQTTNNSLLTFKQNEQSAVVESDQSDELVKMAQSNNSSEREEAIASLLAEGSIDDPNVKATLEAALTDRDDNVRAQAISTLAHLEGSDATGAIQNALHDDSVDVRLRAVDVISNDIPLLQQAMNDSNETVRTLAKIKLETLSQASGVAQ